jgi:hypothetical protein
MQRTLNFRGARGLLILAAALATQACASDQNSSGLMTAPGGMSNIGTPDVPPPVRGELTVCSFTQDGDYQVTVNGVPQSPFFILADNCVLARANALSNVERVTVKQLDQTGFAVDSVVRIGIIGEVRDTVGRITSTSGTSLTVNGYLANEYGGVVVYYNTF